MSQKRILILNGHPSKSSISGQLAHSYEKGAKEKGHDVRLVHLADTDFDPNSEFSGYKNLKPLEPHLESFLDDLSWCEHFVLVAPMWWGGFPARLKGMIDRAFLPGRTFDTRGTGLPKPMFGGRIGRVILTSDSPWWYFRFFLHRPLYWQIKRQILGFVGFKPVRISHFSQASEPKPGEVEKWLKKARNLAIRAI